MTTTEHIWYKNDKIRQLNDEFRQNLANHDVGTVPLSPGIHNGFPDSLVEILDIVQNYTYFTPDSDPYRTHDFGQFILNGVSIIWKIDYYAHNMYSASPAPDDPHVTVRVLTILLASEY